MDQNAQPSYQSTHRQLFGREAIVTFRTYAGVAGMRSGAYPSTNGWHPDCNAASTDVGGLCSSDPDLHQAASNGSYDGCLSADADGNCGHTRGNKPNKPSEPPTQITTGLVLFYV